MKNQNVPLSRNHYKIKVNWPSFQNSFLVLCIGSLMQKKLNKIWGKYLLCVAKIIIILKNQQKLTRKVHPILQSFQLLCVLLFICYKRGTIILCDIFCCKHKYTHTWMYEKRIHEVSTEKRLTTMCHETRYHHYY